MTWVKLDDHFADHPKLLAAGPLAGWMHVAAMCWSARHKTDGFVPGAALPTLASFDGVGLTREGQLIATPMRIDPRELAGILVAAKLWEEEPSGYRIHDYLQYNPSKAEMDAEKEGQKAGGRTRAATGKRKQGRFAPAGDQQGAGDVLAELPPAGHQARTPSPSPGTFLFEGAAAPRRSEDDKDASAVVAAYANGRKAGGHEPCDPVGKKILGRHAKTYLAGPKDARITQAEWYDPAAERVRRLETAIKAATDAGEQGRNPGFLTDWLVRQKEIVARQHHSEHGRGRVGTRGGELRPLRIPQAVAG